MSCLLSINNYYYRRGGAEVVFLDHNRLFEDIGWDVVPFAMHHPSNLPTPWAEYFVEEIEFGRPYTLAEKAVRVPRTIYSLEAQRNLKRLLERASPQIAHAHNVYHHLSPSIFPLLKRAGVPTLMTVHDPKIACPAHSMFVRNAVCERCRGGRIHNVVRYRCVKDSVALSSLVLLETLVQRALGTYRNNVDRFVVPSRFYVEKLVEWGWPRDRLVHLPNAVDVERFEPDAAIGERFVFFGRLDTGKGLPTLIRAAALARQPLTLVGTGPDEPALRRLAEEIGADVIFAGFQAAEALHAAIKAARAVVLPSEWYENAPLSVMEAYALGRPVIGARIGGIPELIRDGETGAAFTSGDPDALAAELSRFAALPASRLATMGAAGRRWVETHFSRAVYRNRMLALYQTLAPGAVASGRMSAPTLLTAAE